MTSVLHGETLGVSLFIRPDRFKIRQLNGFFQARQAQIFGPIAGAPHPGDVPDSNAGIQCFRDLQDRAFSHAVDQKIGLGIQQDRPAHFVAPVIVMTEPAKAGFQAADDDRNVLIGLFRAIGVDDDRPVRTFSCLAARRVLIDLAPMQKDRIVVDHGIHDAAVDQKSQPRFPEYAKILSRFIIRLRQDRYLISISFQQAADDRSPERVMIHIGIPGDQHKIRLRPSPRFHFFSIDR